MDRFKDWSRGRGPLVIARAPGRVNLIGEHTDYNEGLVLPVAINRELQVIAQQADGDEARVVSGGEEGSFRIGATSSEGPDWLRFPLCLALVLLEQGHHLSGAELMVSGDLPMGVGLSSSAAFGMALLMAFVGINGLQLEPMEVAQVAHEAEQRARGVECGIMDQAIARLGQAGHALLLDCRSLEYRQIPINVEAEIVVCDTGIRRELSQSPYNRRREECLEAVAALSTRRAGIRSLRDVSTEDWEELRPHVPEPARRRAEHVIYENQRVLDAAQALEAGDIAALARLFAASQNSLRENYEVSCAELDILVEIAHEVDEGIPSRLTGAGFGGCTVNLVPPALVRSFEERLRSEYPRRTGREGKVYQLQSADGASSSVLGS